MWMQTVCSPTWKQNQLAGEEQSAGERTTKIPDGNAVCTQYAALSTMWSGLCLKVIDTYIKQQCMGQVPLLIIIDMQQERKKSLKKSKSSSWGNDRRKENDENNARLPAERLLLIYELEQDPGTPICWSQELGLNFSDSHKRLWTSESQLRPECS